MYVFKHLKYSIDIKFKTEFTLSSCPSFSILETYIYHVSHVDKVKAYLIGISQNQKAK